MELEQLLERIERLEQAVFGTTATETEQIQSSLEPDISIADVKKVLEVVKPLAAKLNGDRLIVQSIVSPESQSVQISSLSVLKAEEDDDSIAELCGALSSRQRIAILRHVIDNPLTSGELADATGMAGGHLHHHLRELMHLELVEKDEQGRYTSTNKGVNVYLTVAGMHRRLFYRTARSRTGVKNDE